LQHHQGDPQVLRSFEAQVTINHFAVAAGEHWNLEAELADAAAHAIDDRVVLPGVARVEDQAVNGSDLNLVG
jgi:hypothetical protein